MAEVANFVVEKMKREALQVCAVFKQIQDRYYSAGDVVGMEFISAFQIKYTAMMTEMEKNNWDISKIPREQQEALIHMVSELVTYNTERY